MPTHCRQGANDAPDATYRTIFENTGTATCILEADTTIAMVNSEFERLSGYRRDEIEGKVAWPQLIVSEDRERMIRYHHLRRSGSAGAPRHYEFKVRVRSGEIRPCYITVALIPGTGQSVASITDITPLRQLENLVMQTADQERQRIGAALHDDLASHLVGVEALSCLLASRLKKKAHPQAAMAKEITSLVREAIVKIRILARGLLPVDLDAGGLLSALRKLAAHVEKIGSVKCEVHCAPNVSIGNNTAATHLFHIAQEAVTNAFRHSGADHIRIYLSQSDGALNLEIADSGKGFPREVEEGLGLDIMRHRASMIGGTLDIMHPPGGGTLVRCTIDPAYLS